MNGRLARILSFSVLLSYFFVTDAKAQGVPNLSPYKPSAWSDRIVVSTSSGTNTDSSTLYSGDELFVDWAVINNGTGATDKRFLITLSVDGQEVNTWFKDPPLNTGFYANVKDYELGPLSPGTHILKLVADITLQIEESSESDNEFTRTVQVVAPEKQEPQTISILFPSVQSDGASGTGVAIANPTDALADVTLYLLNNDGSLTIGPSITNPRVLSIEPDGQIAQTIPELFGEGADDVNGWILASSENLGIVGFFLNYSQDGKKIDGAEARELGAASTLVFPEVLSEENAFTEISLIGVGSIDLELYSADGQLIDTEKITLPADVAGRFTGKLSEIFSGVSLSNTYLIARSSKYVIMGYESFGTGEFLAGRNAIPIREIGDKRPTALFGAQLADISNIKSVITLINPTNVAAELTFSAFRTGVSTNLPSATSTNTLAPKSMIRVDARSLLGLPPGDFVGWLRVDSDAAGIVGDITFGDPDRTFLSSVQLQTSPVTDAVFSHVADGLGFLTGITFLNPSVDPAAVTLEVFNKAGQKTGTGSFILEPFEHNPRLLGEIIPGFEPQIGGYIRVKSDIGIFTFELFSVSVSGKLVVLAAVPPQIGYGTVTGKITPGFIGTSTQGAQSDPFEASNSKGIMLDLGSDFVPGEVIVKFKTTLVSNSVLSLAQDNGWKIATPGTSGAYLLQSEPVGAFPLGTEQSSQAQISYLKERTLAMVEELNANPDVLYAEPNYIYYPMSIPNDPRYSQQWHYPNINLPAAWDISIGSPNVVVAVIDSGAKFLHPDLGPRLNGGQYDFIRDPQRSRDGDGIDPIADDPGNDPSPGGSSFHGTHVAGTIGAVTNNGVGVAGVNWVSPLMTLRVLGLGGGANYDIAQAILYAAGLPNDSGQVPSKKANVINMSLGGSSRSRSMGDAVAAAQAENVVVVAAAGNDNTTDLHFPAAYDGVISVGATDLSGGKTFYSNFGPRIDIVAPGGNTRVDANGDGFADGVLSTLWDGDLDEPIYKFYQGTSMASPHVAGVVSLMLSVNPDLTPFRVREILQQTAIDLGELGRDDDFGFGLIDPVAALQAAGAQIPEIPKLEVSTNTMNFGSSIEQAIITLFNSGGGTLQVNDPTVEMDQASGWLSVGLSPGRLIVTVDRTGFTSGSYTGRIRLTSNGGTVTIEVLMEVGDESESDIGTVYVLVLDPATLRTIGQATTTIATDFRFQISPLAAGNHIVVAGTDLDGDGFICEDEGDFCGLYPVSNQPSLISVQRNSITSAINFTIEKNETQTSSSAVHSLRRGFEVPQPINDKLQIFK